MPVIWFIAECYANVNWIEIFDLCAVFCIHISCFVSFIKLRIISYNQKLFTWIALQIGQLLLSLLAWIFLSKKSMWHDEPRRIVGYITNDLIEFFFPTERKEKKKKRNVAEKNIQLSRTLALNKINPFGVSSSDPPCNRFNFFSPVSLSLVFFTFSFCL